MDAFSKAHCSTEYGVLRIVQFLANPRRTLVDKGADTRRKNNGKPTKDTNESACTRSVTTSTRSPDGVHRDVMYGVIGKENAMNIEEGLSEVFDNERQRQSFLKVRRRRCLSFFLPNHNKSLSAGRSILITSRQYLGDNARLQVDRTL